MYGNVHLKPLEQLFQFNKTGVDLPALSPKGLSIDAKSGKFQCWVSEKDLEADAIFFFIPSKFLRKLVPISEIKLNLNSHTRARTFRHTQINNMKGLKLPSQYRKLVRKINKIRTEGYKFE